MANTRLTQFQSKVLVELAGLDELSNVFGPLGSDIRKRLIRVLKNPTEKNWENAYSIILHGPSLTTLWQAWIAIDPTAPRSGPSGPRDGSRIEGWSRIPTADELFVAIRHAATLEGKV